MSNLGQWDTHAQLYEEGIGDSGDELHSFLIDPLIFKYLEDYRESRIIDAGCGNGYLIVKLAQLAKSVIGIDGSMQLLEKARKRTAHLRNVSIHHLDISDPLPFEHASCDVVIANMVLQYLPSLSTFAIEVHDILSSSGKLIIVIDHPAHALFVRAQELAGKKNEKFLTNDSYFTSGERTKRSLWDKAVLTYVHRTIADYVNAFTPYFKLESMDELTQDRETPRILGLKFIRI